MTSTASNQTFIVTNGELGKVNPGLFEKTKAKMLTKVPKAISYNNDMAFLILIAIELTRKMVALLQFYSNSRLWINDRKTELDKF